MNSQTEKSPFLGLPQEVRHLIYSFITSRSTFFKLQCTSKKINNEVKTHVKRVEQGLLKTNFKLTEENENSLSFLFEKKLCSFSQFASISKIRQLTLLSKESLFLLHNKLITMEQIVAIKSDYLFMKIVENFELILVRPKYLPGLIEKFNSSDRNKSHVCFKNAVLIDLDVQRKLSVLGTIDNHINYVANAGDDRGQSHLQGAKDGDFILRTCSELGYIALSIVVNSKIDHYKFSLKNLQNIEDSQTHLNEFLADFFKKRNISININNYLQSSM